MLAGDQLRQVAPLLVIIAVTPDLVHAKVRMRAIGEADARASPAHLLHGDAMFQIAKPGAAPFLFDSDAVQAERAHRLPEVAREGVGAVDFGGARRDLVLGECADGFAQHVGVFAEAEIEAAIRVLEHYPSLNRRASPFGTLETHIKAGTGLSYSAALSACGGTNSAASSSA